MILGGWQGEDDRALIAMPIACVNDGLQRSTTVTHGDARVQITAAELHDPPDLQAEGQGFESPKLYNQNPRSEPLCHL